MAHNYPSPPDIEIAALRQKTSVAVDLMRPGGGTPWEDRGTLGTAAAFLRTTWMSLASPTRLFDLIRRPETSNDARRLTLSYAAFWAASVVIHSVWLLSRYEQARNADSLPVYEVDRTLYWVETAAWAVAAVAGLFLFVRYGSRLYFRLVSTEIKQPVPPALLENVFAYALGPSVVAPVPLVGPPLAVIWILVLLAAGGISRLRVSPGGGAVAGFLATAVAVLACVAAWVAFEWVVWEVMTGGSVNTIKHVTPPGARP